MIGRITSSARRLPGWDGDTVLHFLVTMGELVARCRPGVDSDIDRFPMNGTLADVAVIHTLNGSLPCGTVTLKRWAQHSRCPPPFFFQLSAARRWTKRPDVGIVDPTLHSRRHWPACSDTLITKPCIAASEYPNVSCLALAATVLRGIREPQE